MTDLNDIQVAKSVAEMKKIRTQLTGSVGFIPTMGYLHEGHVSLVKLAKKENEHVIVSIFINPKQFEPNEDFNAYPRDTQRDLQLLKNENVDVVFLPSTDDIYPPGYETYVAVENITEKLEGRTRPGHFTGVTTIISKLFNIIAPQRAYFGKKDAQQVVVVKKMVSDLHIPVEIVVGETMREPDGLAMSSRNIYLSKNEHEEATILFKSLKHARELFNKGERNPQKIKSAMKNLISTTNGRIDYISVAHLETLHELHTIEEKALISLAVYFGKTRLIDNIIV